MAVKRPASHDAKVSLLSPEDRVACQAIAALQAGLARQRAAGLLALAEGTTQLKAAELSGLTIGQIRYLLAIFRRKGMAIFPADIANSSSPQVALGQTGAKIPPDSTVEEPAGKEKKKAKAKKEKGKTKGGSKHLEKKAKKKKGKDKTKKKKKDKGKKAK